MNASLSLYERRQLLARYRKLLAHYEQVPERRREDELADVKATDLRVYIAELEEGLKQTDQDMENCVSEKTGCQVVR
jgi:hypothetical protein